MSLSLNDPVHVKHHPPLEGVVAYLGPVQFGSAADKDDWVGVRLTGSSVGAGKNDGSVKGVSYFQCPAGSGIFVRAAAVSKRHLTRLEELRLRRELANVATASSTGGGGAGAGAAGGASGGHAAGSKGPSAKTPTGSSTSSSSAGKMGHHHHQHHHHPTSASSRSTKLEELRRRRAALSSSETESGGGSSAASGLGKTASSATTTTTPKSSVSVTTTSSTAASSSSASTAAATSACLEQQQHRADVSALKEKLEKSDGQIQDLADKLRDKEMECSTLQQKLSQTEQDVHDARTKLEEKEQELSAAEARTKERSAASVAVQMTTGIADGGDDGGGGDGVIPLAVREEFERLQQENDDLKDQLHQANQEIANGARELEREREQSAAAADELTAARSEATALSKELQAASDLSERAGAADASHYKEKAKLQAEISALKRRVEQNASEKQELEHNLEDLTLDKEQLQEEKEALEDRVEELKLDVGTAQMEVEELRLELEDAQAAADDKKAGAGTAPGIGGAAPSKGSDADADAAAAAAAAAAATGEAEDMAAALSVQNARLRDALIRLREQSAVEKMDLSRQLRTAEKKAEAARALESELETLRSQKQVSDEEINDLKDMVEQGAAFEGMVEELSDRVLSLEEDVVSCQATLREMEEAAELTAEMEEVQADELRALTRDLEGRDTIIHNLEQAIRMQRRREEDFKRTVGNYRTAVETLRQEKRALLELQQGAGSEKTGLIEASQKALARAAQLVQDAADMRKREAAAVSDKINHCVYRHLSVRLQRLLPAAFAASEVSAIKGELMVCKLLGKASQTLRGIAASFGKTLRPGLPLTAEEEKEAAGSSTTKELLEPLLSDEVKQQVAIMIHQSDFGVVIARAASHLLRWVAAGQWPDLLTKEASTELGSVIGHSIGELDGMLGAVLKSLKEEGVLTQEQSNLGAIEQTVETTLQSMKSEIERDDLGSGSGHVVDPAVAPLVPATWNPPGWQLYRDATQAKFACLGAAAAMAPVVEQQQQQRQPQQQQVPPAVVALYNKLEQGSAQASNICLRLTTLDVRNDKLVRDCTEQVADWRTESERLLESIRQLLMQSTGDVPACQGLATKVLRASAKVATTLRSAKLNVPDDISEGNSSSHRFHALSPETDDAWDRLASLSRHVRAVDGDKDDVNFLLRARTMERRLEQAVDDQPKLEQAHAKIATLEKSLASRSKEIAMQQARLSELEKLLAKSSSANPLTRAGMAADLKSSEEFQSLKEENRVLTEAMDVLQRQVDEYENEIRALKDFKSPGSSKGGGRRGTPRRSLTIGDLTPTRNRGGGVGGGGTTPGGGPGGMMGDESIAASTNAFEAALFRPVLQRALNDAARWRAEVVSKAMYDLPPLPAVPSSAYRSQSRSLLAGEFKRNDDDDGDDDDDDEHDDWMRLHLAVDHYRTTKSSVRLVDLTRTDKSPREQLREQRAKVAAAGARLEAMIVQCRGRHL